MPDKKLSVGDPVLWYGWDLEVTALETNADGVQLACIEEVAKAGDRAEARHEIETLRQQQQEAAAAMPAKGTPGWAVAEAERQAAHARAAARIAELSALATETIVRAKLRADLLSWWPERGVWVSDGRIMSNAQIEKAAALGLKSNPQNQRHILALIGEV